VRVSIGFSLRQVQWADQRAMGKRGGSHGSSWILAILRARRTSGRRGRSGKCSRLFHKPLKQHESLEARAALIERIEN